MEPDKAPTSERSLKSRAILARQVNGIVSDQACKIFVFVAQRSIHFLSPLFRMFQ